MLSQFIRIQTHYSGVNVGGCLLDGLVSRVSLWLSILTDGINPGCRKTGIGLGDRGDWRALSRLLLPTIDRLRADSSPAATGCWQLQPLWGTGRDWRLLHWHR